MKCAAIKVNNVNGADKFIIPLLQFSYVCLKIYLEK